MLIMKLGFAVPQLLMLSVYLQEFVI